MPAKSPLARASVVLKLVLNTDSASLNSGETASVYTNMTINQTR